MLTAKLIHAVKHCSVGVSHSCCSERNGRQCNIKEAEQTTPRQNGRLMTYFSVYRKVTPSRAIA